MCMGDENFCLIMDDLVLVENSTNREDIQEMNPPSPPHVLQEDDFENCNENNLGKLKVVSGLEGSKTEQCRGFSSSGIGNLSLWRGKKKILGREGLLVVQEMKRFKKNNERIQKFMKSHVSRLLKSDLLSVLAEFQRQDEVFLALKIYNVVRKEIWYKPDKPFYRDMLFTLARNKKREEAMIVWQDMKGEEIHLDQHTYGDIVRAFLDNESPSVAMKIYEEMRESLDPPLELPYRVILKGLLPYPALRDKVKQDFQELFPDIQINDIPEEIFDEY
ncbi:hypothetical protein KI387_037076 [Taxus chinensis]|uniref:Pentatricopeptide repeat-containing protein n=1 Tax=Taxus chinensis TaxID=29808 RepID=A0AA38FRX5_TAXCH|nr:hypothetical protein KI387_037076 [Taxus chinensis]